MFTRKARAVITSVVSVTAMALSTAAGAQSLFVSSLGGATARDGYTGKSKFAGTVGTSFTVGADSISVSALGYYDGENTASGSVGDGLMVAHQVGIYDAATSALIATATIPAGTGGTLTSGFRFVPLGSAVTLNAGSAYVLAGQVTATDLTADGDIFMDNGKLTTNPPTFINGVTIKGGLYSGPNDGNSSYADGKFVLPSYLNRSDVYFGPNFAGTVAVPEPGTLTLLAGCLPLGGLFIRRRSRR